MAQWKLVALHKKVMQDDISALLQKKKNKTLTKKHFNIAKNNCLISVFLKGSFVPSLSREQIL